MESETETAARTVQWCFNEVSWSLIAALVYDCSGETSFSIVANSPIAAVSELIGSAHDAPER